MSSTVPSSGYTLVSAFQKCINSYATFGGRARRSEFWYFILATSLVNIALQIVGGVLGDGGILGGLWSLGVLLPGIAVSVRRLHDIDRTGYWYLLVFTGIGVIALLYWAVLKGDDLPNRFGPPPT